MAAVRARVLKVLIALGHLRALEDGFAQRKIHLVDGVERHDMDVDLDIAEINEELARVGRARRSRTPRGTVTDLSKGQPPESAAPHHGPVHTSLSPHNMGSSVAV